MMEPFKNIFFPKQCVRCNHTGHFICLGCRQKISNWQHQRCIVCQKPSRQGFTHPKCQTRNKPERLISIFDYHDQTIAKLINIGKMSLIPDVFSELTDFALQQIEVRSDLFPQFVVCPIPLTKAKLSFRGFNQSQLIAKQFAQHYGLVFDCLLQKTKHTKQQKSLNKLERSQNLQNSFNIPQPHGLPNKVLLIDDITTTGSTFLEAGRILKLSGIKTVWCLALAQD